MNRQLRKGPEKKKKNGKKEKLNKFTALSANLLLEQGVAPSPRFPLRGGYVHACSRNADRRLEPPAPPFRAT